MINVVYLGTPQIAVNALNKLINFNDINMVYVITPNDKPQGRGYKTVSYTHLRAHETD